MTIRAKFAVYSITRMAGGHTIRLTPVTSGSEENASFYKYTPGGSIELTTINDSALEVFGNPGDQFYVEFTPAKVAVNG